jgi:hypothetical protein
MKSQSLPCLIIFVSLLSFIYSEETSSQETVTQHDESSEIGFRQEAYPDGYTPQEGDPLDSRGSSKYEY